MSPGMDIGAGTVPGGSAGTQGFEDAEGTISSVGLCGSGGRCCGCLGTLVGFWGEGRDGRVEMLLWGF